jgi:PAS domain S-box-containing protein
LSRKFRFAIKGSFGLKVLSSFIAVIIVVLSAFTIFAVVREGNKTKQDLREQGEMLAGLLSHNVAVGVFAENKKLLKDEVAGAMGLKDVMSVSVYNTGLTLLYEKNKGTAGKDRPSNNSKRSIDVKAVSSMSVKETDSAFEIVSPVVIKSLSNEDESIYFGGTTGARPEKVIGYVRVVLSKDAYHKELSAIVTRNAVITLVFIFCSTAIVYFVVIRATRPLNKLTENVKALGKGLPVEPSPVESEDELGNLASAFNAMVLARREAEVSLRESEERYRRVVELSPDAIIVLCEGRIAFINAAGVKLFGAARPIELLERPVLDFIHDDDCETVLKMLLRLEEVKAASSLTRVRCFRLDGTSADTEMAAAPFTIEGLPAALVIVRDITERTGMEEKLQTYREELSTVTSELSSIESRAEERERHLIAADLHDHIGQNLALSQIKLGALREALSPPDLVAGLDEIRDLIGQTLQYTRSLTVELSPPVLYELGLEAAVEWLAEKIQRTHGIRIGFQDDGRPKVTDDEVRFLLFKIVRELLLNVVKHSRAGSANVSLARENSFIRITVADDGVGFDPASVMNGNEGFGLFVVRRRLNAVGGRVEIESVPNQGTRVTLTAKLRE